MIFNLFLVAPKDGRMAGFDEDGGYAPWMAQPEDPDQGSNGSSGNGNRHHKEQILPPQRLLTHSNTNGYSMAGYNGVGENGFIPGYYGASADASRYDESVKIKAGKVTSGLYNTNGNFYFDPSNMSDYMKHQQNGGFPRLDANEAHSNFESSKGMDASSFGVRHPGSSSFPWFPPMGDSVAHDGAEGNSNNYSGYYESNLKASASSVSLSEFAMSLWPSMNNLATAAEAVSSSGVSQGVTVSPPQKPSVGGDHSTGKQLGSLSRLDSLSNVALDELEAMATSEADKKASAKNADKNSSTDDKVKMEGAQYDVGYSIDEGGNAATSKSRTNNSNVDGNIGAPNSNNADDKVSEKVEV